MPLTQKRLPDAWCGPHQPQHPCYVTAEQCSVWHNGFSRNLFSVFRQGKNLTSILTCVDEKQVWLTFKEKSKVSFYKCRVHMARYPHVHKTRDTHRTGCKRLSTYDVTSSSKADGPVKILKASINMGRKCELCIWPVPQKRVNAYRNIWTTSTLRKKESKKQRNKETKKQRNKEVSTIHFLLSKGLVVEVSCDLTRRQAGHLFFWKYFPFTYRLIVCYIWVIRL